MKKIAIALIVLITSISLAGCADMTKQDVGTVSGGVIGGLVGSQFGGGTGKLVAVGAGALAGALIGGAIGKNMDDTDRMKMNQALESNSVGQPAYWQNQKTGTDYSVTPTKNVTVDGNQYCREYRSVANIAGKKQQVYGTACRQPDGSWQVVS
ncbi:MAG TPA: RT0821/Lpp0805 family surface protein [Gammaproteobacteria bacterium]|nr:RT0821/Lpp0805 family surface protein [Gammaproteobacteria bacterium]